MAFKPALKPFQKPIITLLKTIPGPLLHPFAPFCILLHADVSGLSGGFMPFPDSGMQGLANFTEKRILPQN